MNSDANRDAELTTTADLTEYGPYLLPAGVTVTEPKTETEYGDAAGHYYGYIHIQQVQRAALADGRYDVTLSTTVGGQPAAGAHVLGLAGDQAELFVGQSPSIRPTRLNGTSGDTNDQAEKYWMPKLVVRREGSDLRSDFVTMIEPLAVGAQTSVASIESSAHNGSVDDLAVKVTHADGTVDMIISSLDPASTVTAEGVSVTGKLGFARLVSGAATKLHLVGGTTISTPGKELTGTGAATGPVTGTRRTFTGDPVNALITTDGGNTLIELDGVDPGFMIISDNTSELAFTPFTTWRGATTFRVENSATA